LETEKMTIGERSQPDPQKIPIKHNKKNQHPFLF